LIIVTNLRVLWWFLPTAGQLQNSQAVWWLAYEQIEGVKFTDRLIDPYRPKLTISHRMPIEPKKIRSWQLSPAGDA
jgi:hypothetical protein